jgi:hypothetical protein
MVDQRDLPEHLILAHRADQTFHALIHDENFDRAVLKEIGAIAGVADLEYLLADGKDFTIQFVKHTALSDHDCTGCAKRRPGFLCVRLSQNHRGKTIEPL